MEILVFAFFPFLCLAGFALSAVMVLIFILSIIKRFTYGNRHVEVVVTRPGEYYEKRKREAFYDDDEIAPDSYFLVGSDGELIEVVSEELLESDDLEDSYQRRAR